MIYDLKALLSKTTSKQSPELGLDLDNIEKPHHPKLRSDAVPIVFFFFALMKIKVRQNSEAGCPHDCLSNEHI